MSNYASVDDVIGARVKATGSTLFTEWAGVPARFFHVPGDPPFECFQVSVRPPESGRTAVTARAIDTNDDTEGEMDRTWEGPIAELDGMLGTALTTIEQWRTRERDPLPNAPSPEAGNSGLYLPGRAGCDRAIEQRYRGLVADRAMWS